MDWIHGFEIAMLTHTGGCEGMEGMSLLAMEVEAELRCGRGSACSRMLEDDAALRIRKADELRSSGRPQGSGENPQNHRGSLTA